MQGAAGSAFLTFLGLWLAGIAVGMVWPWSWPTFNTEAVTRADSPRRVEPPTIPLTVALTAAYMLSCYAANFAVHVIAEHTGGSSSSTFATWPQLLTAVAAGLGEEVLVVAVPVAAECVH